MQSLEGIRLGIKCPFYFESCAAAYSDWKSLNGNIAACKPCHISKPNYNVHNRHATWGK